MRNYKALKSASKVSVRKQDVNVCNPTILHRVKYYSHE